uniref:Uncharacterized protein n=1 Tax=Chlorobium phaeobacteroides (strain BS1) TaxID=331678 RepID=B3EQI1_CHLPB
MTVIYKKNDALKSYTKKAVSEPDIQDDRDRITLFDTNSDTDSDFQLPEHQSEKVTPPCNNIDCYTEADPASLQTFEIRWISG